MLHIQGILATSTGAIYLRHLSTNAKPTGCRLWHVNFAVLFIVFEIVVPLEHNWASHETHLHTRAGMYIIYGLHCKLWKL